MKIFSLPNIVFDERIANEFIEKKNMKGLHEYLEAFMESVPLALDHEHPGLKLAMYEMALAHAAEDDNLELAKDIFEKNIKPLKEVDSRAMFPPLHIYFSEVDS